MNWLDSHCHINDEAFKDDLDEVLNRMVENKVTKAVIVSLNPEEYKYSKTIQKEGITFKHALGLYPGDVDKYSLDDFVEYYKDADIIGEIGLDYYWTKENKEKQKEIFIKQCQIASELNKPISVHCRDAYFDGMDILYKYPCKGVLHCYSGSLQTAHSLLKKGYYFSFGGPVTYKNAKVPVEVVSNLPLDRILIETDSPYLPPASKRGQRNEPSYVVETGKKIAELIGINEEFFKQIINDNYDRLFGE